jgi:Aminotransferase class-V
MVNTPPTYNWYLTGLTLEWLKEQGGLKAIEARNIRKAEKLYAAIDASPFYSDPVDPAVRSRMNVPFRLADAALENSFLTDAVRSRVARIKNIFELLTVVHARVAHHVTAHEQKPPARTLRPNIFHLHLQGRDDLAKERGDGGRSRSDYGPANLCRWP